MTTSTPTTPRRPALDRDVAMRLAADEYQRFTEHLQSLTPEQWARPTACTAWDVRDLAAHVIGMAAMAATVREQGRQMAKAGLAARRNGTVLLDELTGLQVRERSGRTPAELLDELARIGPRAARGRRRTPGLVRRSTLPMPQAAGSRPDSPVEKWKLGYLVDVILTRDTWMHRSDVATATGTAMVLTPEHDGVLVADVVQEWAQRHGRPCTLALTGPAGGRWSWGPGGPELELDAVEFCRVLSGRGTGEGLLAVEVPF